jgi:hypothetical protein
MVRSPAGAKAALAGPPPDSPDPEVDAEAEEAWRAEIFRRLQEIDGGAVKLISWHYARRRLRARLQR